MGRHMPGAPNFIVQHMPGAGGLTVVNHLQAIAPRDGTVFATTARSVALEPLIGNANAKFDALKLNWIGSANVENSICVTYHNAPVKSLEDATKTEVIVGGTTQNAFEVVVPKATNKVLGTKFKIVQGYQGGGDMALAMERGETGGFCGIGWNFVKLRKAEWLKDKKINILFQIAMQPHPELPGVPSLLDQAKTPNDRKVLELIVAPQDMGRPFLAPPGVPADRLQALRAAFEKTLKDPQFLAESEKMGIEVQHVPGEDLQKLMERLYASPPEVVESYKSVAQ